MINRKLENDQVDVSMDPVLTIAQAHAIAGMVASYDYFNRLCQLVCYDYMYAVIARKHIERNMTGLASVDVDLELQEFWWW